MVLLPGAFLVAAPMVQPSFSGAYVLDEAASDDVMEAFELAIREMSYVVRQIARPRLRNSVQPDRRLHIEQSGSEVRFQFGGRPAFRTPLDGRPVRQQTDNGGDVERRATLEGNVLRLVATTEEGRQVSVYRLSPDGRRLTVDVAISAERLPRPVDYTLVYLRR